MLIRSHLALTFVALLSSATAACVIVDNTDGTGGDGTGAGTNTGGSTTNTGGNGSGGSTTNAGGGGTGGGGTGGGTTCVDHAGTGVPATDCADMNSASITTCPSTNAAPPAVGTCTRGNEVFSQGAWENLLECLQAIPATIAEACTEPEAPATVQACVDQMYNEACTQTAIVTFCDEVKQGCDDAGQLGYDVAGCKADLNPFGQGGLDEYTTCYTDADPTITCADIHNHCMDLLFQ